MPCFNANIGNKGVITEYTPEENMLFIIRISSSVFIFNAFKYVNQINTLIVPIYYKLLESTTIVRICAKIFKIVLKILIVSIGIKRFSYSLK